MNRNIIFLIMALIFSNILYVSAADNAPPEQTELNASVIITDKVRLMASDARLEGGDISLENTEKDLPNICYWYSGCSASWDIDVETEGRYRIILNYARLSTQMDLPVVAAAGGQTVENNLTATGKWDEYIDFEIGEIELSSEDTLFTITHGKDLKTDLMNLRYVTLEFVETDGLSDAEGENSGIDAGVEIFILTFTGISLTYAGVGIITKKR